MLEHRCAALESMCRLRRAAAKDATGPVTPWQGGNFFPGRSKVLQYSTGSGRRAAPAAGPYAGRLGAMRKKRPPCLAGGDAAGRKDQHKFTVRQRRLPHTDKGSYGLRSYLPASALFTAVKPVTSSAVTDIDCRARIFPFPQIRANSVNSPESVFCLNRLALQSIRLSCRGKYVFSAWFGPDGAVPHLTFSLFQRQNAPAGSKERIFCLPFSERRPLPSGPGHETFTQRGNSAVPP